MRQQVYVPAFDYSVIFLTLIYDYKVPLHEVSPGPHFAVMTQTQTPKENPLASDAVTAGKMNKMKRKTNLPLDK